uniref:Uncharacterized protein n=1 Tax=Ciona intestinalis TaxID=7719 RepID=H2Y2P0_CIOIN
MGDLFHIHLIIRSRVTMHVFCELSFLVWVMFFLTDNLDSLLVVS